MKKVRLLVTGICENNCPLCCNNQFSLKKIEPISITEATQLYDEINITGGNPLYHTIKNRVRNYINHIRLIEEYGKIPHRTVYLYTNTCDFDIIEEVLGWNIDGITITPHSKREIEEFDYLNHIANTTNIFNNAAKTMSFRLCILPEHKDFIDKMNLWGGFQTKHIKWVKNCKLPADEEFKRLPMLL